METVVAECSVERKTFEIKEKELLLENDHLLELIISQDLVHTDMNSLAEVIDYQSIEKSFLDEYYECVELKAELSKRNEMVEKVVYDELSKRFEQARELSPLDSDLDSACKFAKRLKELLVYVSATCPSSIKQSEKLIPVTPINKNKKVRVISSTSASRSKPPGNKKKYRISRPTISNQKNKVEDYLRSVKSSLNKNNYVYEPVCNANVKHYVLNANSELICATYSECMFDAIHDLHVLDYLNNVNMRVKSRSGKSKKKKVWKATVVPPKKPMSIAVVKKTLSSSNNSGKLKDITNIGLSSKSKKVESKISNNLEPNKNWGSNVSTAPSSSRGLGHNLFLVGEFCDSDLEVAFRKHTCYVRDFEGVDLLKGSRGLNLYTMSLEEMMQSSPICILSKASKTKSWLWHRRRTRLIMETIHVEFDEMIAMASEQFGSGPELQLMTPGAIIPAAPAPIPVDLTGSPSLTSIDQDAPSTSTPSITHETQSTVISEGVEEQSFLDILTSEPSS
ncbi:hypothetical protein Tco_0134784 [Tanacetum coccineum]